MASITQDPWVTQSATTGDWMFQKRYIERLMDHNALTAAHPDDTLILAGPPRAIVGSEKVPLSKMLPIGMVQQMQVTQTKPTTPMQAIGSGRIFFVSGKAQIAASIARLFVNGRNLLRALYTNVVQAGIDVSKFDDIAAVGQNNQFFANLDSELFLVPFGMAVLFRDKIHDEIGAFYMELCMINTWAIAVGAGQNMILENVNLMCDRLRPISTNGIGNTAIPTSYNPRTPRPSNLYKAIFSNKDANPNPAGANGADGPYGNSEYDGAS